MTRAVEAPNPTLESHDLVIVGGGPAGLAAAVGSEAESVDTLIIYAGSLGGQASTSSKLENVPFFPKGITGEELRARMVGTALRFNTEFLYGRIDGIETSSEGLVICEDGNRYLGKAALQSSGVQPRRHRAKNVDAYTDRGVTYGSPNIKQAYRNTKSLSHSWIG